MTNPVDKYNKELFDFLIVLYCGADQRLKDSLKMDWESEEVFKARKNCRVVFHEEQEYIEYVIRERLGTISSKTIKVWMKKFNYMPSELSKIFGIAWARNGGYIRLQK